MKIREFEHGFVLLADCTHPRTIDAVKNLVGQVPLIVADPSV